MEIFYNNELFNNDEFLDVFETQKQPEIKLNVDSKKLYSLIMYDPNAVKGTFIHWLKLNITSNDIRTGNIIIPYKGPAPPPGSGIHHYIFELYEQSGENNLVIEERVVNSIDEVKNKLNLNKIIKKIQFKSENKEGGKRKTSRKIRNKSNKNNKSNKKYKNNNKHSKKRKIIRFSHR